MGAGGVVVSGLRGERGLEDKSLNSAFLGELELVEVIGGATFAKSKGTGVLRSGFLGDNGLAAWSECQSFNFVMSNTLHYLQVPKMDSKTET